MGKPNKESLQHRILNRNPEDVTPEDAALADEYIKSHNLQQCREASTGTATFYRWVSNSYTVKPVLSDHSKKDQTLAFKTDYFLMQVKSIAEYSKRAFCNTFDFI